MGARDRAGSTALMIAAQYNPNPEMIVALVRSGSDVNARGENGRTALMAAASKSENPDVIVALLRSGADASARSGDGRRAVDYARDNAKLKGTEAFWKLNDASY